MDDAERLAVAFCAHFVKLLSEATCSPAEIEALKVAHDGLVLLGETWARTGRKPDLQELVQQVAGR